MIRYPLKSILSALVAVLLAGLMVPRSATCAAGQTSPQDLTLMHDNGNYGSVLETYGPGDRTAVFFPLDGYFTYPYEATGVHFSLQGRPDTQWPVTLDVVIFDKGLGAHQCGGPGAELCRFTVVCDKESWEYPAIGSFAFPNTCCLNGPFFIAVEYPAAQPPFPSLVFDNSGAITRCDVWQYSGADQTWTEWQRFWNGITVGYPILRADVRSNSTNCPDHFFNAGGDVNCDGGIDISDCIYLVQWLHAGGPAPCHGADINGDCVINDNDIYAIQQMCFIQIWPFDPVEYTCRDPYIAFDCQVGDADNSQGIDISDAVYLIAYIFSGGPAPALCRGDANADCVVDISDAIFLISYIFSGGPAPCAAVIWQYTCQYQQPPK